MADKCKQTLKKYICPLVLFLLPLRHIAQGIDISDTGYNLACFRWFGELDGMWVYVTYVANLLGHLFTKLPLGGTMLGMNLYCSLVVSLLALCAWYFLRDKIPFGFVFAGETLAILLCWCPQVILYNYLTYLFLTVGTIILYRGIRAERKPYYIAAGLLLGFGVGVRFSNLTHMALILGLWYDGYLKKRRIAEVIGDTLLCAAGYAAGIAAFLIPIQLQYGLAGYLSMLSGLQTMSAGASGYSTGEMLAGAFIDYLGSMKWGVLFLLYILAGVLLFAVRRERLRRAKMAVFLAGFVVLLRFAYGRGMFGFDYHTYFSIFWWVSLFNTAALVCNVLALFRRDVSPEEKLLAVLTAVTVLILPLGSNNRSYPLINDLFLVAPVTLYFLYRFLPERFPVRAGAACCLLVLAVQSVGFGTVFVFRDGSFAEKRDTKVENNGILKGMYTTKSNAAALEGITGFWQEAGLQNTPVILYGDIPGLSYILDAPSAITSTWANLESYNRAFWDRDFAEVEQSMARVRPVVIIGKAYTPEDEKAALLQDFMDRYGYTCIYENEKVILYH